MEAKSKILIIDDNIDIINHLQQILLAQGYEVFAATSGEKALQRIEVVTVDLILLDIIMPGIDGYKTCELIKAMPDKKNIPIIFMSALLETFDKVKAFGLGAVDYITKPLNTEELLVRIKTHLSISLLQRQLFEINTDLEKKIEQRTADLKRSERKYRSLFENSQEGKWVTDETGITQMVNRAIAEMLGYEIYDFTGKSILSFLTGVQRTMLDNNFDNLSKFGELEFRKQNGKTIYTTIEIAPFFADNGDCEGVMLGIIDITDRRQAEIRLREKNEEYEVLNEELKEKNIELLVAKEKAEESDRLKTAFLQNISHEIRTPMNAIHGFSNFLAEPGLSVEKMSSYINIIQSGTKQLLGIVNDILTISAIETKQEKAVAGKVCVNNIIVELLAVFQTQAANQNLSMYARQPLTDQKSEIYTDKIKLTHILTNLISNAVKFTYTGFIEFGYRLKQSCDNFELEFYVTDTGIGINPEMQSVIFERFRQAFPNSEKMHSGTGLGLAISKAFVELLGGNIWVESVPEKGSTFYFTIPYNPVHELTNLNQLQVKQQPTILVAEDEEFNFLIIEEWLSEMELNILHAKNGKQAVEICSNRTDISLVLMDIKMPVLDGHSAATYIKEMQPNLPIIAQTAYALESEINHYSGGVFNEYITKPIDKELLLNRVAFYIQHSK